MNSDDTREDKGTALGEAANPRSGGEMEPRDIGLFSFETDISVRFDSFIQLSARLLSTSRATAKLQVHRNGYIIVSPSYPSASLPKWHEDTPASELDPALASGR